MLLSVYRLQGEQGLLICVHVFDNANATTGILGTVCVYQLSSLPNPTIDSRTSTFHNPTTQGHKLYELCHDNHPRLVRCVQLSGRCNRGVREHLCWSKADAGRVPYRYLFTLEQITTATTDYSSCVSNECSTKNLAPTNPNVSCQSKKGHWKTINEVCRSCGR